MDRLFIKAIDLGGMYLIRYNTASVVVPYFRVHTAIPRLIRRYHNSCGHGV